MIKNIRNLLANRILWSFSIFMAVTVLFFFALNTAGRKNDEERLKITKAAIVRAAVSCYAIEGVYPPSLDYLEQNYGLSVNYDKYFVSYQIFSSNIIPDIDVFLSNGVNNNADE